MRRERRRRTASAQGQDLSTPPAVRTWRKAGTTTPEETPTSEKITKSKALCYVVRGGMLLVHRHVDFPWEEVGVQVPAGSIRQGEAPEAAALREAREETGLQDFKIVRKLGVTTYDMGPYRAEIQERHVFHLEVAEPTPERWPSQEDHDGEQEPTRLECFWIKLESAHVLQSGQGALLGLLEA
ncbi:NUDIX domain-containing protein [Streptomyces parvus]|uniref:NUDIX hydrolase n=1 Tax=Streptomyces parvus TaxID=66428 RepID=UPI0033C73B19